MARRGSRFARRALSRNPPPPRRLFRSAQPARARRARRRDVRSRRAHARDQRADQRHAAGALLLCRRAVRAARRHPRGATERKPFDEARTTARATLAFASVTDAGEHDDALDCLERCLDGLKREDRELIVEYYTDAKRDRIERRRAMAGRLGISMNALGIRAFRLRASLEACVGAGRRRS